MGVLFCSRPWIITWSWNNVFNGWMRGWIIGWLHEWVHTFMDGCMDGCMHSWHKWWMSSQLLNNNKVQVEQKGNIQIIRFALAWATWSPHAKGWLFVPSGWFQVINPSLFLIQSGRVEQCSNVAPRKVLPSCSDISNALAERSSATPAEIYPTEKC